MPLLYVDANPFIYAVEAQDEIAKPLRELFGLLRKRPGAAATSELTLAEVLPKAPSAAHRRMYLDLIAWGQIFDLRPVSREILIETASYRQNAASASGATKAMPPLPDAIHVVTAIRSGCTLMLSTDSRLKLPDGLKAIRSDSTGLAELVRTLQ
jgi:predicted nucleic acid-binding protein